MSTETVIQVVGLILGGIGSVLVFFLTRGIWALVSTVIELKTTVAVFASDLKNQKEYTDKIPKLEGDVNALHRKLREKSDG